MDGVRLRLEPGWRLFDHDDGSATVIRTADEERFEFAIRLERVDLTGIAPSDFLQLKLLQERQSGGVMETAPRRWMSESHGYARRGRICLKASPDQTWLHTREIDSDFVRKRVLIVTADGRRGLLISRFDIAQLRHGRDEAARIAESIELDDHTPAGRSMAGRGRSADAIGAFLRMIRAESDRKEPPSTLAQSYLRLARALLMSGLFDDAERVFDVALSLAAEGAASQETVARLHASYGVSLAGTSRAAAAISALRKARELLDDRAGDDTLGGVEYHLGLTLAAVGSADRRMRREAEETLRSAVSRLERITPPPSLLAPARAALQQLENQTPGWRRALKRLWR